MRLSIKLFFVLAAVVVVAGVFAVQDVSAQGSYPCKWTQLDARSGTCALDYSGGDPNFCASGYEMSPSCGSFNNRTDCESFHQCTLATNKLTCVYIGSNCVVNNDNCSTGYDALAEQCNQYAGNQGACESAVLDCQSTAGAPECGAGAGQRCDRTCEIDGDDSTQPCVDGYSCELVYGSSESFYGVCQSEDGCLTDSDCHDLGDVTYVCQGANPSNQTRGECVSERAGGSKSLGPNQTTCSWVNGQCETVNTCYHGWAGLDSSECRGKSKEDCEAVAKTQCERVENWGTETCFRDCTQGDPGRNSYCNRRCNVSMQACSTSDDCLAGAEGWDCVNGVCKFTGRTGFDCRSGGLIPCGGLDCPCTFCDIFIIINRVVDLLLFTIAPILVSIMVIVGGFFVMTSRGAGQLRKGKELIKWAVLGYLLMLTAWVIVNTIFTVLDLAEWVGAGDWWDPTC